MTPKGNITPDREHKDKDLFNELVRRAGPGTKIKRMKGGISVHPKGMKSQAQIRKEHNTRLKAIRNKMN